jgi:hypothetical protein
MIPRTYSNQRIILAVGQTSYALAWGENEFLSRRLHKMADCSADKAFLRAIKLAAGADIKLFCHAKAAGDAFKIFN